MLSRCACPTRGVYDRALHIDGDHSFEGLKGDWETWSGLMMRNGIVCLHDSQSSLKRNIDDAGSVLFTKQVICKDSRFAVVDTVDSLTVLKRTVD